MKKIFFTFPTLIITLFTLSSHAYDEDLHFYGTYAMARYSGIRTDIASKIALSAQWMDESFLSDPTSMIFLPVTGIKKRRLLHFPSSRVSGSITNRAQKSVLGYTEATDFQKKFVELLVSFSGFQGDVESINLFTETKEDHPFATELLMEGLKEGNLMKAGASLHVLEDSFAHAGTPAEQGHAAFWHWPDRPFSSVPKYQRMTKSVFAALVAIRNQLPPEAIDCSLKVDSTTPNCKLGFTELHASYNNNKLVEKTVAYDILKDPEYVKTSLENFFEQATEDKYLQITKQEFLQLMAEVPADGTIDAYSALEKLMIKMVQNQFESQKKIFDLPLVLKSMGKVNSLEAISLIDYIDSYNIDQEKSNPKLGPVDYSVFTRVLAYDLLRWTVPTPLNDSHRIEIEDDKNPIRKKEMELREANMQKLIAHLFNEHIQFIPNNSKDDVGFGKEVLMDASAEAQIPKKSNIIFATFTLKEKNAFDHMIFKYLFPSLDGKDLVAMVEVGAKLKQVEWRHEEYKKMRKQIQNSDSNAVMKKASLVKLDYQYADLLGATPSAISDLFDLVKQTSKEYVHDLLATHLVPSPDNYYYRKPALLQQYKDKGLIKPLLVEGQDVWTLKNISMGLN